MKQVILFIFMFGLFTVPSQGASYSCRDQQGRLLITDNLQTLPEECRANAEKINRDSKGQLNIVPPVEVPEGTSREFREEVREVEKELALRQKKTKEMLLRSDKLADEYEKTKRERRAAIRSWNYDSREIIDRADRRLEELRDQKTIMLEELENLNLDRDDERQIRTNLETIENEE